MKCSKFRITFRPLVENLESRLQPGSLITGPGYGWSLLADNLSILAQSAVDSQAVVSQSSFAGSQASGASEDLLINIPVVAHSENLETAVVSVAAARSSSLQANGPVENLANNLVNSLLANLGNDNLGSLASASASQPVVLAAAAASPHLQPSPATPMASVPQSPLGVANSAPPAAPAMSANPSAPASSGVSLQRGATPQALNLPAPSVHHVTLSGRTDLLQAEPGTLATTLPEPGGAAGNQAAVNSLSYLTGSAGTGPDSLNDVVVRNEGGTNFLYVAGSATDSTGRTYAIAAKLAGDGSSVVWSMEITSTTPGPGPDSATGLALNGNNVYVVGSFADPASTPQTDGFVAELDANTGAMVNQFDTAGSSFAAVTTDSAGNVDIAGSTGDTTNVGQTDILFLQFSSDLSTQSQTYGLAASYSITQADGTNAPANSSVTTGGGLVLDSNGNAYFAGTIGALGDPNNETMAFLGRVNAAGTQIDWAYSITNVTPGPGGIGTGVALDPNGNVVYTGSLNDNGSSPSSMDGQGNPTLLNQDLLLARALAAPQATAQQQFLDINNWFVDDRSGATNPPHRVGDWTGNSLVVLPDGSTIVTGAAYDPAAGTNMGDPTSVPTKGIDVQVTHFTADDMNTTQNTDGDPENVFGGSGTDIGNALALDPTTSTSPYNVYVVGSTTSTDLPTTANVFGQTYSGTNATGFVGQLSVA